MKIFIHKLFVLFGQIIIFYLTFIFCFFITFLACGLAFLVLEWITDLAFNFSIERSYNIFVYYIFDSTDGTIKLLILIPLILFFMRHFLFILSEEDTLDKDVMVYNPFTQWGNLIYMKGHKEFYDKNEKKFNPKPLTAKAYKKIIKEHKKNLQKKKKKK